MDSRLSIGYCLLTSGHCVPANVEEHGGARISKLGVVAIDGHLPKFLNEPAIFQMSIVE